MGRIGDPLDESTLYGPLHNKQAVDAFEVNNLIYLLFQSNNC